MISSPGLRNIKRHHFLSGKVLWQGVMLLLFLAMLLLSYFSLQNVLSLSPHTAKEGFSGPLIITKGGTYSGKWESKDSEVPAIEVRTREPVLIVNSVVRGAGPLIRAVGHSTDIIVRNTSGYGLPPSPYSDYEMPRRFLGVDGFKNVVVENCYLENTAGIYIGQRYEGNGTPEQTIRIRFNEVKNIDGRIYGGVAIAQFVQFNFRNEVPHAEIAWNEVINEPDRSAVEDNINIYNSRGTADSPILIHDNYIQGAFPVPSTAKEYSGGGILTDSPGADSTLSTAHVQVYNNHLVGLGNYCLGIAGGNHIEMYNNRAIVAARFPDNSLYNCWTSGIWAKDYYKQNATFANKMHHNILATVGQTGTWRNEIMDSTFMAADTYANTILPGKITLEMEKEEYQLWLEKLQTFGVELGVQD